MLLRMSPQPPSPAQNRPGQTLYLITAALLLTVFAVQLGRVAHLYSANWDEAHHLYDGYKILTRSDYRANAEVPPLVKLTAALPLLALHPHLPPHQGNSQLESAFLEGRTFVFSNGGDRLLLPARLVCMLYTLLTALLVFLAGRSLFHPLAGLFALLLFVFDPNVLAHGTLISTDMASACFLFGTVYAFYRYTLGNSPRWLLLTSLLAGLAMVAKYTGILIAPILLVLVLAEALQDRSPALLVRRLGSFLAVMAGAWLLIWAFYRFRYAPAPPGLALSPALAPYLASLPNPADGTRLAFLARHHLLPEAFLWGLANTRHTEWDYTSYFLGHVYRHGPWQYFPTAFLIKSTLPLLLLLVLTPFALFTTPVAYRRQVLFLLLPVLVFFAVITTSHFDIGARHMLPVYPFLYVLTGGAAILLAQRGLRWSIPISLLALWQIVTCLHVSPSYMAYGNEAIGGPLQVRRYLSDANVDWGQQLKTVKAYLDTHHVTNCWFAYFPDGAVTPDDYGIHCRRLPTPSGLWWFGMPTNVPPVISGTVLISESDLDGVESGEGSLNPYDSFRSRTPTAILQDGVYVYDGTFSVPLASAWVAIHDSWTLQRQGHPNEAFARAQQAVSLAPDSLRAVANYAGFLATQGRSAEAFEQYRRAQMLLSQRRPDLQGEELGPQIANGLKDTHP